MPLLVTELASVRAEAAGTGGMDEQPYDAGRQQAEKMLAWDAMAQDSTNVAAYIEFAQRTLEEDKHENGTATEATVQKAMTIVEMAKDHARDAQQREKIEQIRKKIVEWYLQDASKVVQGTFKETMWNEEIKRMREKLDYELGKDRKRMAGGEPGMGKMLAKAN